MSAVMIDEETGEMIAANVMVRVETAPAITLDISLVATYHKEPSALVTLISAQAGYAVFSDMNSSKERKACSSHAASIIRCITPAANKSKRMASEAKKIVNQDLSFRRDFETGVRELAAYHRLPLTEWEDEQARLEAEQLAREEARLAAEKLELDHQDALDMDELITLRKAREAAVEQARLAAKAIEDKRLFDAAVDAKVALAQIAEDARTKQASDDTAARLCASVTELSHKDDSRIIEPTVFKAQKNSAIRRRIISAIAFEFDISNEQAEQLILIEFN
jgi:hypothetical protein